MRTLPNELIYSARRMLDEPFYEHWLKQAREDSLARLASADGHEALIAVKMWHQAVEEIDTAVRRAARTKESDV